MNFPADYPAAAAEAMWGGVAGSTAGVDFTEACSAAQSSGESAENRRRELPGQSPGLGVLLVLPQPVAGPSVGKYGLPGLDVVGEGYDQQPPDTPWQHKAYGEVRPVYAAPEVGGLGYPLGIAQPARRHVTNLGADGLLIEPGPDGRAAGDGLVIVSPAAPKPSLWSRLASKLRRK